MEFFQRHPRLWATFFFLVFTFPGAVSAWWGFVYDEPLFPSLARWISQGGPSMPIMNPPIWLFDPIVGAWVSVLVALFGVLMMTGIFWQTRTPTIRAPEGRVDANRWFGSLIQDHAKERQRRLAPPHRRGRPLALGRVDHLRERDWCERVHVHNTSGQPIRDCWARVVRFIGADRPREGDELRWIDKDGPRRIMIPPGESRPLVMYWCPADQAGERVIPANDGFATFSSKYGTFAMQVEVGSVDLKGKPLRFTYRSEGAPVHGSGAQYLSYADEIDAS